MAKLSSNDPIFDRVPASFESPFPSDAALLSDKFNTLMQGILPGEGGTIGQQIWTRANAVAWRDALALVNKAKVTIAGDLPSTWLPKVAWLEQVRPGVEAFEGLWAEVDWSQTRDPARLGLDVAAVGLTSALNFVGAVPIVGILMRGIVGLGDFISKLFDSPAPIEEKKILLPWSTYSKETDQDLVQKFLVDQYGGSVDWTNVFLPPFEVDVPWGFADGVQGGQVVGSMFAPLKGGQIAWSTTGLGAIPGSERVAGYVQAPKPRAPDPRLNRYFSDGTMMRWGRLLVDTGDFFPAFAQTCTLLWQQAQKVGSPDMYKLDLGKLESAWETYWGTFWESVWAAYWDDEWAGEWAAPYLAAKTDTWRIGLKRKGYDPLSARPHPAPLITPTIFKDGIASPLTRNACAWIEPVQGPTYPYAPGEVSSAQLGPYPKPYIRHNGRIAVSGGPAIASKVQQPVPGGKCIPWPEGEDMLVQYASPFEGIIKPAIDRLRALQEKCLLQSLVVAYVRIDEVQGMPPYAAFAANPNLAAKARDARELLLSHPARYQVRLKDVDDIDPVFADKLRASGVNNSPGQLGQHLGMKLGGGGGSGEEPPPPLPPEGGNPWDTGVKPSGGGGGGLALAAGLGGLLFLL